MVALQETDVSARARSRVGHVDVRQPVGTYPYRFSRRKLDLLLQLNEEHIQRVGGQDLRQWRIGPIALDLSLAKTFALLLPGRVLEFAFPGPLFPILAPGYQFFLLGLFPKDV